jgi:hypothetical protein
MIRWKWKKNEKESVKKDERDEEKVRKKRVRTEKGTEEKKKSRRM